MELARIRWTLFIRTSRYDEAISSDREMEECLIV